MKNKYIIIFISTVLLSLGCNNNPKSNDVGENAKELVYALRDNNLEKFKSYCLSEDDVQYLAAKLNDKDGLQLIKESEDFVQVDNPHLSRIKKSFEGKSKDWAKIEPLCMWSIGTRVGIANYKTKKWEIALKSGNDYYLWRVVTFHDDTEGMVYFTPYYDEMHRIDNDPMYSTEDKLLKGIPSSNENDPDFIFIKF